jgi:hypothetical protein
MLGFKGQYVCPIRLLSHRVVHCDPITLGGGGTCAAPEQASRNAIPDGNVVKFQKSGKPQAPPSAAATSDGPMPRKPIRVLISAVLVALTAAYRFLTLAPRCSQDCSCGTHFVPTSRPVPRFARPPLGSGVTRTPTCLTLRPHCSCFYA